MKKRILYSMLVALSCIFSGCFDTAEELTINADGSGTYHLGMNMEGLFDFMDMMKGLDTTAAMPDVQKKKEKLDTTIHMRHFADTAAHLSAVQKALIRNGKMKMVMNEESREFTINMDLPFSKIDDVEKLMQLSNGGNLLSKAMSGNIPAGEELGSHSQMPGLNNYFDVVVKKNLVERKLNKEKYKALVENDGMKGMKEAGDMLASIKFNTVIHLPRPAKKATGSKAVLSQDKKTVTIKGSMADVLNDAQALTYRIEY